MNKKALFITSILTVLLLGLAGILYYNHHITVAKVEKEVNEIYFNNKHDYINPNYSLEDLEKVKYDSRHIYGDHAKELQELIDRAIDKRKAIQFLNDSVLDDKPIIEGNQVNKDWVIEDGVSAEEVDKKKDRFNFDYSDKLVEDLKANYGLLQQVAQSNETIENKIDHLPEKFMIESLDKDLDAFNQVAKEISNYIDHTNKEGQADLFKKRLMDYALSVKEQTANQDGYSKSLEKLLKQDELASVLTGSPVDYRPLVAITFDDGPDDNVENAMDICEQYGIKATFFLQGNNTEKKPELAREIVKRGHHVANHSYDHPDFAKLTDKQILDQINRTQDIIKQATGVTPKLFRTPYGQDRARTTQLVAPLKPCYWNTTSRDWQLTDPDDIYDMIMKNMQHHSVILQHSRYTATTDALKKVIPELKKRGYVFVFPEQIPDIKTWNHN
ncbi:MULTISPECIES: polysaccharide deacetylase family protein [Aerococcus]|uniref:polysaccharide deacetylase family protein n=1 Tax=Aerococcus TaxID=1375 RepID=UPI0018A6DBED|nr:MULTISPECIES: polysaccharide deacetylase family protein [Aerococcus]MCY3035371.1 polysaccharide deacetylase family protein [Aerococcus sp. Group 2]MCY3038793.1 polysaccharide deacetylase family protein [Aerococcus sp. Group 2]MCY3040948.1 polysaccharide deacetylase family protein [Aerococcus sp. Group 2]MCY3042186.1 polysaccharide deacetylase family protein [Aerococcus sp. Group 2]MDK6520493.1 polysaccharide deacetylase family protein [Aerococcus urinae]